MFKRVLVVMGVLSLVACANRPDAIHASYVSHERYIPLACEGLSFEMHGASANLRKLSEQQDNAANSDVLGIFLLGIPVSKLFGTDKEGEIAKAKGVVEAIETAQIKNGCAHARVAKPVDATPVAKVKDNNGGWYVNAENAKVSK